jgi:hypothetical protein
MHWGLHGFKYTAENGFSFGYLRYRNINTAAEGELYFIGQK